MKINEVTSKLNTYIATVRIVLRDWSTTARTTITSDTVQQAKLMLTRIYGASNVLNITLAMNEEEEEEEEEVTEATKTLSPQELQVKSLDDKADDYKEQAKTTKARQQMAKAQLNLMKVSRGVSAS
jgi:hypothetical protein